jgi:hypothetical protein
MGSSAPSNTTQTTTSTPWAAQQPYLEQGFQAASNLYNNYTPQYYPGSTVSPLNSQQTTGLNSIYNYGMNGSPVSNAANTEQADTLNGDYLSAGNPYFQQMSNSIAATVTPQVESQYEAAGRYGSGDAANATASALSNEEGQLAFQNYGNERSIQQQAAFNAPSINNQNLTNLNAATSAGNAYQNQSQNELNNQVNAYNYYQQLPYQQLQSYQDSINGTYGGTSTSTQPYYSNPVGSALSGALGGAASGAALGSVVPGVGTGIGAIGGGLVGLLAGL